MNDEDRDRMTIRLIMTYFEQEERLEDQQDFLFNNVATVVVEMFGVTYREVLLAEFAQVEKQAMQLKNPLGAY